MKKQYKLLLWCAVIVIVFFLGYVLKQPEIKEKIIRVTVPGDEKVVRVGDERDNDALIISLRGSLYEKDEMMQIWAGVYNNSNKPIASNCNLSIYYPNTSIYQININMTEFKTGFHNYNTTAPNVSGTYFISVNCSRASDNVWAMTDGELQIGINFIERIQNLFTRNFRISSLAAVSPRYASESVEVEATFTYFDGNITPSSINMTIDDPNNNVWASTSLSDFTEDSLHIFKYSKSLSSSPTTGKYSVKMQACYNNYCDSKATQFRVATGGPYKYAISGDSTACLDQPYGVTNQVTNEGEGDTETKIHNWLDIDGDGKQGSFEPQVSFQKEVAGYSSFSEVAYIRMRDDTPEGYYTIRGNASYVGGAQPPAVSSFTVRLERCGSGGGVPLVIGEEEITYLPAINITKIIKEIIVQFKIPWWIWLILALIMAFILYRMGFFAFLWGIILKIFVILRIWGVIVLLVALYIIWRFWLKS